MQQKFLIIKMKKLSIYRSNLRGENEMQSWLYLTTAICLEVSGTTCMKLSSGFSKMLPSFLIFIFYGFSFASLTMALKRMDLGMAYAIWSGIGTTLIASIGIVYFKEPATLLKIGSIVLIIIGVIGLNMSGIKH